MRWRLMPRVRDGRWALALAGWSVAVWGGRVRNVVADDALSDGGRAWRLALAGCFVAGGIWVLVLVARRARLAGPAVRLLAAFTIAVWLVRGTGIVLDDHAGGFKAVHSALAATSIAIAVLATQAYASTPSFTSSARVRQRQPPPAFKNSPTGVSTGENPHPSS